VAAITINHEGLSADQIAPACDAIRKEVGLPAFDVLRDGPAALVEFLESYVK
jgi:uncharacterized NAD-dependent epimerase/dehydratase family protein